MPGPTSICQAWWRRRRRGGLKYSWTVNPSLRQEFGVGWSSVLNASHVADQTRQDWFAWWEVHYQF